MNYYEHHLGDYIRDAAHLSMVEEGAYRRLLDQYYVREAALPTEERELYKLARATTKVEKSAVDYVIGQFFLAQGDGYHQARCDEEIERFKERAATAKRVSQMGVEARRAINQRSTDGHVKHNQRSTNGSTAGQPLQSPVSSHQSPIPTPSESGGGGGYRKRFPTADEIEAEEIANAKREGRHANI